MLFVQGEIPRDTITLIKHHTIQDSGKEKKESSQSAYRRHIVHSLYSVGAFVVPSLIIGALTVGTARAALFDMFTENDTAPQDVVHVAFEKNSQTLALLEGARNIDPNLAKGGGAVVLDDDQALVSESAPFSSASTEQVAPSAPDQISLYMVQEGDTLSQVAEMFDVSVNTVVWANELSSNKDIHPGETLLILPISGVQHTIEEGDTLKSIAEEYGADGDSVDDFIAEITEYNDISSDTALVVGETLTVPGGEMDMPTPDAYVSAGSGGSSFSGYLANPMGGWYQKTQGLHGYNAIDFGADYGTPILAAASGKVIVSRVGGWNGGYGNYIVIEHPNGIQTLYSHNSRHAVWQGQTVVQGQVIGYVGSTGRSTGNHLHFEVRGARNPF